MNGNPSYHDQSDTHTVTPTTDTPEVDTSLEVEEVHTGENILRLKVSYTDKARHTVSVHGETGNILSCSCAGYLHARRDDTHKDHCKHTHALKHAHAAVDSVLIDPDATRDQLYDELAFNNTVIDALIRACI